MIITLNRKKTNPKNGIRGAEAENKKTMVNTDILNAKK
jgi:hypothetical protein